MVFDKAYYDGIWGTVHRHDYADEWVPRLLPYGKRILDVGCGCGWIVKVLLDRGCDAWGVEISDYAIENNCAPGRVLKANATDLPFKDDRFDLVFSNGLWPYLTEAEVDKAAAECWRVGKTQLHNYEYSDGCVPPPNCITWKPLKWWEEKLSQPKVLIACPTHICKEYSFEPWIAAVKAIRYKPHEVFVVDNSPNGEMISRYGDRIPMIAISSHDHAYVRICNSMEIIRRRFLAGNYSWWLNLECDIIPEPDILNILLSYSKQVEWVGHCYPLRGQENEMSSGIGCSLLSKNLVADFSFQDCDESPDCMLWRYAQSKRIREVDLYHHCKVKHLSE